MGFARSFESLGHTVVANVGSGTSAIQSVVEQQPDIVLMDIRLEGELDGIATAANIRDRFPIPIIFLTAYADDHTLGQALKAHPYGYLVKPFKERELHAAIAVALRQFQIEREYQTHRDILLKTLTSIGDAAIATDREGRVTFINPVAESLTGWTRQDAIGANIVQVLPLLHEQTQELIPHPALQAMHLGSALTLPEVCLLRRRDGTESFVGDSAAPIKDLTGQVIGSVLIMQNATQRRQSRLEQLRHQQVLQERILELEAMWLDLQHQYEERVQILQQTHACTQTLNQLIEQLTHSFDETNLFQTLVQELGRVFAADRCWIALHDRQQPHAEILYEYCDDQCNEYCDPDCGIHNPFLRSSMLGTTIHLGSAPHFYLHLFQHQSWLAPSGHILPDPYRTLMVNQQEWLICPICEHDLVIGEIGFLSRSQQSWSALQVELIMQVLNQCAIALHQIRLCQTTQIAAADEQLLNQMKDDFISSVSHELRTPLANMRVSIEMLQRILRSLQTRESLSGTSPEKRLLWQRTEQYLQILHEEWQQESALINDLLNFQDSVQVLQPLPIAPMQLNELLPEIINRFVVQATRRRLFLTYYVPSYLPAFHSHLSSFDRILTELLNNACKFTPPHQTITVQVDLLEQQLKLAVTNTGIEIPLEEIDKIFQPFYRIPGSGPWNYGGTGLGLALIKRLVTRLGGTVQAHSQHRQTCFTVTLPNAVPNNV